MSALLETSLGDIVIDLLVDESPKACEKYVSLPNNGFLLSFSFSFFVSRS